MRHRRPARGSEEFVRVLGFSDGLFAIAMTLLVVSVSVPVLKDGNSVDELSHALNDRSAEIVSFFISFVVIGRYALNIALISGRSSAAGWRCCAGSPLLRYRGSC